MINEFYRNERPGETGGGSGGGGGGGFWGGGGGGGGGGSGSIHQDSWSEDSSSSSGEEQSSWSDLNSPLLKVCPDGFLLTDGVAPELLTGSAMCHWPPAVIGWISGDKDHKHYDCLLLVADKVDAFQLKSNPQITEQQLAGGMCMYGFLKWFKPGVITFSAKWQAGHYDHGKISRARFAVFGVDLGYRVLALKKYITVFTIKITENYEIYVNSLRGSFDGNKKFLE